MAKTPTKPGRASKNGDYVETNVLGTTKDGVRILKPRGKATHFTKKELLDAVASARAFKRAW
jgi:hypothetical protein